MPAVKLHSLVPALLFLAGLITGSVIRTDFRHRAKKKEDDEAPPAPLEGAAGLEGAADFARDLDQLIEFLDRKERGSAKTPLPTSFAPDTRLGRLSRHCERLVESLDEARMIISEEERRVEDLLHSTSEAIIVVDASLRASPIYSRAAQTLLARTQIAGEDLGTLLFPNSEETGQAAEHERVVGFLATAFELLIPEQFADLAGNAPSSFRYRLPSGSNRRYALRFQPVIRDDLIVAISVSFHDTTDTEHLESASALSAQAVRLALDSLAAQLAEPGKRAALDAFTAEMLPLAEEAQVIVRELAKAGDEAESTQRQIAGAFRNVHTVKGSAKIFGLHHVHEFAHSAEAILSEARNGRVFADELNYTELPERLEHLVNSLRAVRAVVVQVGQVEVDLGAAWRTFQSQLEAALLDHAKNEGKQVLLRFSGPPPGTQEDLHVLRMVLPHMLHNAIDHGIESPEGRVAAGKSPLGHLDVQLEYGSAGFFLQIGDDGRGIDRVALAQRAFEKGVLARLPEDPLDIDLVTLLCCPGFSSAPLVTHTSGRGVGMDAVREAVENLGGALSLESVPGVGTHVILSWDRRTEENRSHRAPKGSAAA